MKQYKIWQAPAWAFFSTQFYRDLATHGKGVGFIYLLVLLILPCTLQAVSSGTYFYNKVNNDGRIYAEQIPTIKIKDGKLSVNVESPYLIQDPNGETNALAFDTSGNSSHPSDLNVPILITEREAIYQKDDGSEQQIIKFDGINDYQLDKAGLLRVLSIAAWLLPLLEFLVRLPLTWLGHIIQAFALSLAGMILAKMLSINIKYESILRVSSFALGNVIVLDTLAAIFPVEIAGIALSRLDLHWGFIKLLTGIGYTLFGVSANLSVPTFQSVSDLPDEKSAK